MKYKIQVYHGEAGSIWYLLALKPDGDFDIVDTFPSRARLNEVLEAGEVEEEVIAV